MNIDLAPTFVELAGRESPSTMDGMSLKTLLMEKTNQTANWRTDFFVEHTGEVEDKVPGCPKLNNQGVSVRTVNKHCH